MQENSNITNKKFSFLVGDSVYNNDFAAMAAWCKDRNQKLEYVFDAPQLWNTDWSAEPTQAIEKLCDNFTRSIASQYDDICIGYTGGTDSNTVLRSFLRCGIKNVRLVRQNSVASLSPQRKNEGALIQKALYHHHGSQLRQLGYTYTERNMTDFDIKKYQKTADDFQDSNTYGNHYIDTIIPSSYNVRQTNDMLDKIRLPKTGRRSCFIMGFEKPRLIIKDSMWCVQHVSGLIGSALQWLDPSARLIYYFMDNDAPDIHKKIAWNKIKCVEKIIRREKYSIDNIDWANSVRNKHYKEITYAMGYQAIDPLLDTGIWKPWMPEGNASHQWTEQKFGYHTWHSEFFYRELSNQIDHDVLNESQLTVHGILQKPTPVCSVSSDIISNQHIHMEKV